MGEYYGDFENDSKKGEGRMVFNDGGTYDGEWEDDKPNGFGFFEGPDKTLYAGEWKENKRKGWGLYLNREALFISEWKDNKINGNSIIIYEKCNYQGQMRNNLREGFGRFENESIIYVGDFSKGKFNGFGYLIQKQLLASYNGSFKDNFPHGFGVLNSKTGFVLKGLFKKGQLNGESKLFDANLKNIYDIKFSGGEISSSECHEQKYKDIIHYIYGIFPILKKVDPSNTNERNEK